MSRWKALGVGVAGAIVGALVDPFVLPLAAVTVGAVAALVLARRVGAQKHFDAVGATFALTIGVGIPSITVIPQILAPTPRLALAIFGLLSGLLVGVKWGVGALIRAVTRRFTEKRTASRIWRVLSTLGSVVVLAWSLVRIKERVVRTGALGIAAPLSLVLNLAGRVVDLPWFLDPGVDLLAIVYVGCVVIGFHTLASWYAVLALKDDPLIRAAGAKTKGAATTAGAKTKEAATTAGTKTKTAASKTRDAAGTAGEKTKEAAATAKETTEEVGTRARARAREEAQKDGWDVPGADLMGRIVGANRAEGDAAGNR